MVVLCQLFLVSFLASSAFLIKAASSVALVTLYAPFDAIGLKGNISFTSEPSETSLGRSSVRISVHLATTETGPVGHKFAVSIHANPVFYGQKGSCSKQELGTQLVKLTDKHGAFELSPEQSYVDDELELSGQKSIWSRSLLIQSLNSSSLFACGNIFHSGQVKTAEATFTSAVAGSVIFLENELGETFLYSNLFQVGSEYKPAAHHDWKLLVTDILDSGTRTDKLSKCSYLSQVLDADNTDDKNCSSSGHAACKMGDLTRKHGQVTVGSANNRYSKVTFMDTALPISAFLEPSSARQVFLVLFEKRDRVLACARVREVRPREVSAEISMDGVRGSIRFAQRYKTDPTVVTVNLGNLAGRGKWYHVHEFPVSQRMSNTSDEQCGPNGVGGHFNPFNVQMSNSPKAGTGTVDQYEVGDLSGKYGPLTADDRDEQFFSVHVDMNLPLFGTNSIIGRSVVIHRPDGSRWICASIGYPDETVTLEATFRFPVVGVATFRQLEDEPLSETTVTINLSYNDATTNSSDGHAWRVHVSEPGRDFYNWSQRCSSTGHEFNPYQVGPESSRSAKCSAENYGRCAVGDLTAKSRKLSIAAYRGQKNVKLFYTDNLLPLSGPDTIAGRSLVIYDEKAPTLRGTRMACTAITKRHALVAGVRKWRAGDHVRKSNLTGSIVFSQDTPGDATRVKVDLRGLNSAASGYHVHKVWVPLDREFPCSQDSIYGHYNPFEVDVSVGPLPGAGTVDQYEVGDLSGKFGPLDFLSSLKGDFMDANLPLHGSNSIIGRSVVVHKKDKGARWVCGTVELIEKSKKVRGKEIVAVASFDDPRHLVRGYVRLRQFVYEDRSLSTTWVEVDLKHQGLQNRNITTGHPWTVFVNQVGVDAFNDFPPVKCLAAGFLWNPYLSDSTNKHYKTDCSSSNPLRCAMGDLTGRHGPLTIGDKHFAFSDDNLPLMGNYSVLGRSLVIFHKNSSELKMACSNIKLDNHLVSSFAVKRHRAFTVARFMESMRKSLEASEALIVPDLAATNDILDGECIQLSVHFYGFEASKLQSDFSNLLNVGSVRRGAELVKTFYKPCRSLDELNSSSSGVDWILGDALFVLVSVLCTAIAMF